MDATRAPRPSHAPGFLWLHAILFGVSYLCLAALGRELSPAGAGFVTFWLPAGLYVATLVRFPARRWPVFVLVAVAANSAFDILNGKPPLTAALFSLVNTIEAVCGAWLVRRFVAERPALDTVRCVLGTMFCASVVSPLVGATLGAGVVAATTGNAPEAMGWLLWWSGDLSGVFVVAPIVITWPDGDWLPWRRPQGSAWRVAEAAVLLAVLGGLAVLAGRLEAASGVGLKYLVLPLVGAVALRFGPKGVSAAVLVVAVALGPALGRPGDDSAIHPFGPAVSGVALQGFVGITALSSLLLSALWLERAARERDWRDSAARFREIFDHSLSGVALHDLVVDGCGTPVNYVYRAVNPAFEKHTGIPAAAAVNRLVTDVIPGVTAAPFVDVYGRVATTGEPTYFEQYVPPMDRHFEIQVFSPRRGQFATIFRDITDRKRREAELRRINRLYWALSQINQLITRASSSAELFAGVSRILVVDGELTAAWVGALDRHSGRIRSRAESGRDAHALSALDCVPDAPAGRAIAQAAWDDGTVAVCNDIASDASTRAWVTGATACGIAAAAAFVVQDRGRAAWVLALYSSTTGFFRDKEMLLFQEAVGDMSFALDHIARDAERQQLVRELEESEERAQRLAEVAAEHEARLALALESAAMGAWSYDLESGRRWFDPQACQILGVDPARFGGTHEDFLQLVHPDDREAVDTAIRRTIEDGLPYTPQYRVLHANGTVRFVTARARRHVDAAQRALRITGLLWDVTDQRAQALQLEREAQINQALAAMYRPVASPGSTVRDVAILALLEAQRLTDSEHGFVSEVDPVTRDCIAHTLTEMVDDECQVEGEWRKIVFPCGPDGRYGGLWGHALNTGEPFFTNHPLSHPSTSGRPAGHLHIERYLAVPVLLDGEVVGLIALANPGRDYTGGDLAAVGRLSEYYALAIQRSRYEASLRAALEDQTALLREVHHRVKNNLQVMTSLLNLQASQVRQPDVLNALRDAQARIRSMSLLHETLYRSGRMERVDLVRYVESLCNHLAATFGGSARGIGISHRVIPPDLSLPIDQATCCGLIVSELVANAFKHAFRGRASGAIRVEVEVETDGACHLRVADDGVGLPAATDVTRTDTLGLDLVSGLTRQMQGTMTVRRDGGTAFDIRFTITPPGDAVS
jgi:PAS domain S-box-containing protein